MKLGRAFFPFLRHGNILLHSGEAFYCIYSEYYDQLNQFIQKSQIIHLWSCPQHISVIFSLPKLLILCVTMLPLYSSFALIFLPHWPYELFPNENTPSLSVKIRVCARPSNLLHKLLDLKKSKKNLFKQKNIILNCRLMRFG